MTHLKHVKYGWKPDPTDTHDKVMSFKVVDLASLPNKIDLRESCSFVENQATLGSCTANAAVGALEYLDIVDGAMDGDIENYSRLFVYYNTRKIQGTLDQDSGGTLRDTIKALAESGACDERLWPYDIPKFKIQPGPSCYEDAAKRTISEYSRLESFPDCLACLAAGFPFVFGFMTYDNFNNEQTAKTGILGMPAPENVFCGGHAVLGVGYDMETKTILVRNSWGQNWGMNGYFSMPFSYVSDPRLAQDFWTIRK